MPTQKDFFHRFRRSPSLSEGPNSPIEDDGSWKACPPQDDDRAEAVELSMFSSLWDYCDEEVEHHLTNPDPQEANVSTLKGDFEVGSNPACRKDLSFDQEYHHHHSEEEPSGASLLDIAEVARPNPISHVNPSDLMPRHISMSLNEQMNQSQTDSEFSQHCAPPSSSSSFSSSSSSSSFPSSSLQVHSTRTSLKKNTLFKCDFNSCDKTATTPSNLKAHKRTHLPLSKRPHSCNWDGCYRRFWTITDLNRHSKIHQPGTDMFECGCGKEYTRKDSLLRHGPSDKCMNGPSSSIHIAPTSGKRNRSSGKRGPSSRKRGPSYGKHNSE